jgi:hypothetical protein
MNTTSASAHGRIEKNAPIRLEKLNHNNLNTPLPWVTKNTAILIIHGIGNQLPMETLDQFTRGLLKQYQLQYGGDILLEHLLIDKECENRAEPWFDNAIRIRNVGSEHHIDVYEYYWSNYTKEKASWSDINKWLQTVASGAKKFYRRNEELGVLYDDSSFFFKNGHFLARRYRFVLSVLARLLVGASVVSEMIFKLLAFIPIPGLAYASEKLLEALKDHIAGQFTQLIGDIVVYNVTDPKSKFFAVRNEVLGGAVKALRYLIESRTDNNRLSYPNIVVAGHSLGSLVAYDAINRINLLVNKNVIQGYDPDGKLCGGNGQDCIADQLSGFITFGSPLDKIAFFLREFVPDEQFLRQQLLDHYHGFKQQQWSIIKQDDPDFAALDTGLRLLLENVPWKNYFDNKDYVSGSLDYYKGLTNVDCFYEKESKQWFSFTHGNYWTDPRFYNDVIHSFLK